MKNFHVVWLDEENQSMKSKEMDEMDQKKTGAKIVNINGKEIVERTDEV